MKRRAKELTVFGAQLIMFYVFPLCAEAKNGLMLVLSLISATLLLSALIGVLSDSPVRYLYPPATAAAFIPSVFIYYNESALVHALWYLAASAVGLLAGAGVKAAARGPKGKN